MRMNNVTFHLSNDPFMHRDSMCYCRPASSHSVSCPDCKGTGTTKRWGFNNVTTLLSQGIAMTDVLQFVSEKCTYETNIHYKNMALHLSEASGHIDADSTRNILHPYFKMRYDRSLLLNIPVETPVFLGLLNVSARAVVEECGVSWVHSNVLDKLMGYMSNSKMR